MWFTRPSIGADAGDPPGQALASELGEQLAEPADVARTSRKLRAPLQDRLQLRLLVLSDPIDLVVWQEAATECRQLEPAVRRALQVTTQAGEGAGTTRRRLVAHSNAGAVWVRRR
jgi:hypothetical protein